jgi:hypothetical protein
MEGSLPMERPFLGPLRLLATSTRVAIFVDMENLARVSPKKISKISQIYTSKFFLKKPQDFPKSSQIYCRKMTKFGGIFLKKK